LRARQRAIARELGYSHTTVTRALAEPVDRRPAPRQRPSDTHPQPGRIRDWLRAGLSGVRMLELAFAPLPDRGRATCMG